jgi:hypothetical protein
VVKRAIRFLAILPLVAQRSRHLQSREYSGMERDQQHLKSGADCSRSCSLTLSLLFLSLPLQRAAFATAMPVVVAKSQYRDFLTNFN